MGFQRVSMSGDNDENAKASAEKYDEQAGGGYLYLKDEIQPTGAQKLLILLACALLSSLMWAGFVFLEDRFLHWQLNRIKK